jgi:hypothetical protein
MFFEQLIFLFGKVFNFTEALALIAVKIPRF